MKFCVPIDIKPEGGVNRFLKNFIKYLRDNNAEITKDILGEYDILFVNSWIVEYPDVLRAKRKYPKIKVVHRIDGSSLDYGGYSSGDKKQAEVNLLADLTIFQSTYSRYATTKKYNVISNDGPVIYNPVDVNIFYPSSQIYNASSKINVACATWSTNPGKGAQDIYKIAIHNPDIDFILIGRYPDAPNISNLHKTGVLAEQAIADKLRYCSVFLHMAENDPCPNVVIEALASGLPVLYKDRGGTAELVGDCGVAVKVEDFRKELENVLKKREDISAKARQRAMNRFAPGIIFQKYLEAISSCMSAGYSLAATQALIQQG